MSSGYCDPSCEEFVSPAEAVLVCSMRVNPEAPLRLTTQSAVTKIRGKRPRGARNVLGGICRALLRKHSFIYFRETRPWDARNIVVRPLLWENMSLFLFSREIAVGRLRHVLRK